MEIPTLINANSTVKGELILRTDTRVDGKIFGKVETDQTILIGKEGYFKGFLRARNLIVFGRVEGNFLVSGETIFHSGSSIIGILHTKEFGVKDGANINARIETFDALKTYEETLLLIEKEMTLMEKNLPPILSDLSADNDVEIENGISLTDISTDQKKDFKQVPLVLASIALKVPEQGEEIEHEIISDEAKGETADNEILNVNRNEALPEENIREQLSINESGFFNLQSNAEITNANPIINSALFSSLLKYSVNQGSSTPDSKTEFEKNQSKSMPPKSENKKKAKPKGGFDELRDLLIHPKFTRVEPDEKLIGPD